jgi:CubicO group peptidase (beta-lactamase class C family)
MPLSKILTYFILPGFIITSCNSQTSAPKTDKKSDSAVFKPIGPTPISDAEKQKLMTEVDNFYEKNLTPQHFNGAILVAKKGNIIFEKYNGYFNIHKRDSILDQHSAFHLASLSKTFTAMATLKLMEQGKLSLSDDIRKYLPTIPYQGITIFMLLTHRSALPNYIYFMEDLGWDRHKTLTNQDVIDYIATYQPALWGKPGTHFRYCNTNYALLASIIEKASGKTYPDYMNETFFRPLQMNDTYVFTHADSARAMPSFNFKGIQERLNYLDGGYGDKNIYSTPRDLLKWDQALYNGMLFRQATLDSAFAPYSNEKPGVKNYGLGWRMNIYPNGKKIIFHTGWWHGNNTILIRLMADSSTIIVLGNKYNKCVYNCKKISNLFQPYFETDEEDNNTDASNRSSSGRKKYIKRIHHPVKHKIVRKKK